MRLLIATDAFRPQVNGVVRSLEALASVAASDFGCEVSFLGPHLFRTVPLPTYPEIRISIAGRRDVAKRVAEATAGGPPFDHIHIATEGPIGFATRRFCLGDGLPFTTSYHTHFPDYVAQRLPIPRAATYALLRRFHNAGEGTMVATPSLARELQGRGFQHLMPWSRGVDHKLFSPTKRAPWRLPRPIFICAGRVAPEKNLGAFLSLDLPGSKVVVGDGPAAPSLKSAFPDAHFVGYRGGEDLAVTYASADVFVFPSRTDTFGIVVLEALASGLPVAAFPVSGPADIIADSGAGVLDVDLRAACLRALEIPGERARAHAERFTWREATKQFLDNVAAARAAHGSRRLTAPTNDELTVRRTSAGAGWP